MFARTILDGRLYTIVKLIWKLIQSRLVPTLVLVDIFWLREREMLRDQKLKMEEICEMGANLLRLDKLIRISERG